MELVKGKEQSEYSEYNLTPKQIATAKNLHAMMGEEAVVFLYALYGILSRKCIEAHTEINRLNDELEQVRR